MSNVNRWSIRAADGTSGWWSCQHRCVCRWKAYNVYNPIDLRWNGVNLVICPDHNGRGVGWIMGANRPSLSCEGKGWERRSFWRRWCAAASMGRHEPVRSHALERFRVSVLVFLSFQKVTTLFKLALSACYDRPSAEGDSSVPLSVRTRCVFFKSKIVRSGSVRFSNNVNASLRFGSFMYPTVRFGTFFRCKSYGAVRCGFQIL